MKNALRVLSLISEGDSKDHVFAPTYSQKADSRPPSDRSLIDVAAWAKRWDDSETNRERLKLALDARQLALELRFSRSRDEHNRGSEAWRWRIAWDVRPVKVVCATYGISYRKLQEFWDEFGVPPRKLGRPKADEKTPAAHNGYEGKRSGSRPPAARQAPARQLSPEARKLAEENLGLASKVASSYCSNGRGRDFDDLEQTARIGLMEAAQRFDSTRGVRFSTFAWKWMHGSVQNALNAENRESVAKFELLKEWAQIELPPRERLKVLPETDPEMARERQAVRTELDGAGLL